MNAFAPLRRLLMLLAAGLAASPLHAADSVSALLRKPDAWFAGAEAATATAHILSHQAGSGGWPKNTNTAEKPFTGDRAKLTGTFDNGATTDELRFLARRFLATRDDACRAAFARGLRHILDAQYPTGGWPQYYPTGRQYHRHITFNDEGMVRIMRFLREIASEERYSFAAPADRSAARAAFDRGVQCILKCQIRVDGRLTVWCAQHDEIDLSPRPARSYELVSLSGAETVGIVRLLMSLENHAPEVVASIEAAVAWLESVKISGMRVEKFDDPAAPGGRDLRVVRDPAAPPLWARFYEIGTNRPIFCDRDGVKKYALADIGHERRNGYRWLSDWPRTLLEKEYPGWKQKRAEASARALPEAEQVFHQESRWLGADAALSVPIASGRTLWLFGDTFIATSDARVRAPAKMVRNTVAVQDGVDPRTARMSFCWGAGADGEPDSFFGRRDGHWYWPGHGIRLKEGPLVLFLYAMEKAGDGGPLGFACTGYALAVIDHPDAPPSDWRPLILDAPPLKFDAIPATAAVREGNHVVAVAIRQKGVHAGALVRYPAASLARGDVAGAQWWAGEARGWVAEDELGTGGPAWVFDDAGAECSLHWSERTRRYVHVASYGFGATTIGVRTATSLTGPWSAPVTVFRPPESDAARPFVYAAKGHPELDGPDPGDLLVTYAANSFTFADLLRSPGEKELYWPRMVCVPGGGSDVAMRISTRTKSLLRGFILAGGVAFMWWWYHARFLDVFPVASVDSATRLTLRWHGQVTLAGIIVSVAREEEARRFLERVARGKRVLPQAPAWAGSGRVVLLWDEPGCPIRPSEIPPETDAASDVRSSLFLSKGAGRSLNALLVREGLALADSNSADSTRLIEVQHLAERDRLGLWRRP